MKFPSLKILLLIACMLTVTACSNQAVYTGESFSSDSPFKIKLGNDVALVCESARRALLGQGYLIENASNEEVKARKALKRDDRPNTFIEINVVCLPETAGTTLFATGLLSTYSLKKSTSSASVGVSALGSISLPIGQSADSLVKVSEETIDDKGFYQRFFAAIGDIANEMQASQLASEPQSTAADTAPPPLLDPASGQVPEPVPENEIAIIPSTPDDADSPELPAPVMSEEASSAPAEVMPEVTLQSILNDEMTQPVQKTAPVSGQKTPVVTLDSILSHDSPAVMPEPAPATNLQPALPDDAPIQEAPAAPEELPLPTSVDTPEAAFEPTIPRPVDDSDWHYDE